MLFLIFVLCIWTLLAFLFWASLFFNPREIERTPVWVKLNFAFAMYSLCMIISLTDDGWSDIYVRPMGGLLVMLTHFFLWPVVLAPFFQNAVAANLLWLTFISIGAILAVTFATTARPAKLQVLMLVLGPLIALEAALLVQNEVSQRAIMSQAEVRDLTVHSLQTLRSSIRMNDNGGIGPRHAEATDPNGERYHWSYYMNEWRRSDIVDTKE